MDVLILNLKYFVGDVLYRLGLVPSYSTDITETVSAGHGELDEHGFWEYPAKRAAMIVENRLEKQRLMDEIRNILKKLSNNDRSKVVELISRLTRLYEIQRF